MYFTDRTTDTKIKKIRQWLRTGTDAKQSPLLDNPIRKISYGKLRLEANEAYTYSVLLARFDREKKTAWVNLEKYSCTSSIHRNLILAALKNEEWTIYNIKDGTSVT